MLREHGFDATGIEKASGLVESAFDLSMVFNRFTFGDDYLINKLGVPQAAIDAPDFDLLSALGLTLGRRCLGKPRYPLEHVLVVFVDGDPLSLSVRAHEVLPDPHRAIVYPP